MHESFLLRRQFLRQAASLAAFALPALPSFAALPGAGGAPVAAGRVSTELLEMAYFAAGPADGRPVVLVHDFGGGIDSFARSAPLLAAASLRVLAPQLRGHGATRFIDAATPRSGQQAALGKDLLDFIDALHIPEAVFAGSGWGAHAAWAASRVRPTRCVGLVLAGARRIDQTGPRERYLYASAAGRRALERSAPGRDNPDYARVVAHAWLSRHAPANPDAAPDPRYAALERGFTQPPHSATAAIVLEGGASAAPPAFADAVLALVRIGTWRT